MELNDLKYFCTAADTEHISKAAAMLGVSQPFLTKVIRRLEEELGCTLFDHVGRHVKLNKDGKILYDKAKIVLSDVDAIYDAFPGASDGAKGSTITLATSSSAYCSDIPILFTNEFPNSGVRRDYYGRQDLIKVLEQGRVDFAICSPPISTQESDDIESETLHKERACLLIPVNHPLAEKDEISVKDLDNITLITTLKGSDTRNQIDLYCEAAGVHPKTVFETIDNSLIIKMVEDGMGCTIFAWNFTQLLQPSEKYVAREFCDATGEIGLCWNKKMPMTKDKKRFYNFVQKYFETLK